MKANSNRTLAAVRKLFNWALQRGIVEASPVALVEMPGAEEKRGRTLAADEIRAVRAAAGELGNPFGHFFCLALATGQRRGGTHVVVRKAEQPPTTGSAAPFDLMVDDIEGARRDYAAKGLGPSDISKGRIHDSFHLPGPDGYDFTVVSSHARGRIV